ncbi:hypothetical protein OVY01_22285 [Robbsia sp. Bb-Pol-6]|uniref:Uncharacterized protein n=1 Tax=Robbsia betulipollinis TaxID=2981849 RepID=A0ABT3ZTJ2_9BURK|nr:hypothetical protein [Robbsia betulipollinis]MCY0389871.1 hypothetical protein [Robbsia betulipollinis]
MDTLMVGNDLGLGLALDHIAIRTGKQSVLEGRQRFIGGDIIKQRRKI